MAARTTTARELERLEASGLGIEEHSIVREAGSTFLLARTTGGDNVLAVGGDGGGFSGEPHESSGLLMCPLSAANAEALRGRLPWLRPSPLGLKTSAGFGDQLGLATPGHVRAVRAVGGEAGPIAPIFAQQSVRENARTGRTPQQVLDDALWGLFAEGWRAPWGADADHLKTADDVEAFAAAGYTFFTIDPGGHVDDEAHVARAGGIEAKVLALPWGALEDRLTDLEARYLGRPIPLNGGPFLFERRDLWRAAAKYGRAVAHTAAMYRAIVERMGSSRFELEVSVDETASPTSVAEHVFIASELGRLGVRWVSLAPRFVGEFEKGVDYIGDLEAFAAEFARHAQVARTLGPYKLSLHSGSDKFSIYPIAARLAAGGPGRGPLVHLKTAGTSYLEALRTVAAAEPELFREILAL
ncbi:MAG TPA: tagaturonate epimerase family protein, partial [Chondromyces sp.]|nr:tagaturonate epimerase family protein [Chondromyces sp.]